MADAADGLGHQRQDDQRDDEVKEVGEEPIEGEEEADEGLRHEASEANPQDERQQDAGQESYT